MKKHSNLYTVDNHGNIHEIQEVPDFKPINQFIHRADYHSAYDEQAILASSRKQAFMRKEMQPWSCTA